WTFRRRAIGQLGRRRRRTGRRAAVQGRDVEHARFVEPQRADFLERRVEQDERLTRRVDPDDLARRAGAGDEVAPFVEGERHRVRRIRLVERLAFAVGRDLVNDAFVAGAREEIAFGVHGERPDVLVLGVEKRLRVAVAIDEIDLSVRRRRDEQPAVRRRCERVDFQLGAVEEQRPLALRVDLEDFAFVAAADKQRAVGLRGDRPQKRRGRFVHELGRRSERELAAAVDRQIVDVTLEELGLRRGLEEFRRGSLDRKRERDSDDGGGRRHRGSGQDRHQFWEMVIVSVLVPLTACSVASSHSPSVALCSGLKLPPLRSPSSTPSTEGGSDVSVSPLTTAPASELRSLTYSVLFRRARLSALITWSTLRALDDRVSRCSAMPSRPPSETRIDSVPLALAGIWIGTVRSSSSPRYVRSSILSGTVRPARGRMSSSQTRSSTAVFGCSTVVTLRSIPSSSTFS